MSQKSLKKLFKKSLKKCSNFFLKSVHKIIKKAERLSTDFARKTPLNGAFKNVKSLKIYPRLNNSKKSPKSVLQVVSSKKSL